MNVLALQGNIYSPAPVLEPAAPSEQTILYFVPEIWIDGEPLARFSSYAVSLAALQHSALRGGDFAILTCWCGVPECAGIRAPITVRHTAAVVHWAMTSPQQREWQFDIHQYKEAIANGLWQLRFDFHGLAGTIAKDSAERLELVPGWEEDQKILGRTLYPYQREDNHGQLTGARSERGGLGAGV